jgi:hypothetical protein
MEGNQGESEKWYKKPHNIILGISEVAARHMGGITVVTAMVKALMEEMSDTFGPWMI